MNQNYDIKNTKQIFEIFRDKEIIIYLNNEKETKVSGTMIHHTSFEVLMNVKVKFQNGKEGEKLRLIPKHSILIVKEK
ncbi:hypothetical protein BU104_12750 [Staphylococcus xylosus]|uniref:Uncharacterized protein n=1 Tax=Staphylococcus xylosus TaxID=1288 RepID=A0AAQ0RWS7_STAXY|nr:hypothetical protein [Staphylococcus xylosus]RIM90994.1 hypothetical protein BU104_12750 [Staphylococcus xylosus]